MMAIWPKSGATLVCLGLLSLQYLRLMEARMPLNGRDPLKSEAAAASNVRKRPIEDCPV